MSRESAGIAGMMGEDGKRLLLTRNNKAAFMQQVMAHLTGENGVHIFLQDDSCRAKVVEEAKLAQAKAETDDERATAAYAA